MLGSVLINSGTLAFYRASVVRAHAEGYARETFRGTPMQMNDDSMLTLYARLAGRTVHQPSAVVFTLVPERPRHYLRQQLRWMRGTTVRHLWWLRYLPPRSVGFWIPVAEYAHLLLALCIPPVIATDTQLRSQGPQIILATLVLGCAMNYLTHLRIFCLRRSDESLRFHTALFLLSPLAGFWRLLVLRPLYIYAMLTCGRVGNWGTRAAVEVFVPAAQRSPERDAMPGPVPTAPVRAGEG